ncbi:uncharacterized protein LY89DRAFT_769813 [Mollisia scopiformis]|uniref:Uncharacterized protein n=1 Tax=Mollisia scopiformis TaxID=149040 RepID=A0A132B1Q3_MOLSC|nr:uncharacterized protein LY89DRAFT_769813 [Mollisia scopiformis]KUJ06221.1 hypothetical protein LY89DRAFT_769813 [Mollisia scopiformis]
MVKRTIRSFSRSATLSKTDPSPITSGSTAMKRKRSNTSSEKTSLVSVSDASGSVTGHASSQNTPTRRPKRQRNTARQHLDDEIRRLRGSVPTIEELIAEAEREHAAIREKREREMESIWRRRNDLVGLKEYLQTWGAQDKEWTTSQ